jgi:hypothetical protein
VSLDTLQVLFDQVASEDADSALNNVNATVLAHLHSASNVTESIHRLGLLELLVEIVVSLPKKSKLARGVVDWLREVCDDNVKNCQKVLKSPGLLPVLLMLSTWELPACAALPRSTAAAPSRRVSTSSTGSGGGDGRASFVDFDGANAASGAHHTGTGTGNGNGNGNGIPTGGSGYRRDRSTSLGSYPSGIGGASEGGGGTSGGGLGLSSTLPLSRAAFVPAGINISTRRPEDSSSASTAAAAATTTSLGLLSSAAHGGGGGGGGGPLGFGSTAAAGGAGASSALASSVALSAGGAGGMEDGAKKRFLDRSNYEYSHRMQAEEQEFNMLLAAHLEKFKLQVSCSRLLRQLVSGTSGEVAHSAALLSPAATATCTDFNASHLAMLINFAVVASRYPLFIFVSTI